MNDMLETALGSKGKIRCLKALLEEPGLSINALAKKAEMPYSAVHRLAGELASAGFLKEEQKRNSIIVSLNESHELYGKIAQLFSEGLKGNGKPASSQSKHDFGTGKGTILIHHNADPDAVGSAIALARGLSQKGLSLTIVAPEGVSKQSKNVLTKYPYPIEQAVNDWSGPVFILDTPSPEQLPGIVIPDSAKVIIIDHHSPGKLASRASVRITDEKAHSTAVLVYGLMQEMGVKITREIEFFLLVGIVADTGFFRIAGKKDFRAASELLERVELGEVLSALSMEIDISERIAISKAAKRSESYLVNGMIIAFSRVGSFESSAARSIVGSFADVSCVFNTNKEGIRISARGRQNLKGKLDLSRVLSKAEKLIEGSAGGHDLAASANGKNTESAKAVEALVISELERIFGGKAERIA